MTKLLEGSSRIIARVTGAKGVTELPRETKAPRTWTMILLDVSGSMEGAKLAEAKKAVRAYALDACSIGEWVGLMTFSEHARLIVLPGPDGRALADAGDRVQIEGGTNITPALKQVELLGEGIRVGRKVVVVTDGMTGNPNEAIAVADRMRRQRFLLVTRGIPESDEEFLRRLRGPEGSGTQTQASGLVTAMREAVKLLPETFNNGGSSR